MKNQKICIIGDGLTGLVTALTLKNLNLDIDLYFSRNNNKNHKDKRTTAISNSNYEFLINNIKHLDLKYFWPCKKINLFYEDENRSLNFLNFEKNSKNLMYIFENYKLKNLFKKLLVKNKINLINRKISDTKKLNKIYDLVILCLGRTSPLYDSVIKSRSIKKDYKEMSITGYVKHNLKKLNPSQHFLNEGPFAILPFDKNTFSFVWSVNKNFYNKNKLKIKEVVNQKIRKALNKKCYLKIFNIQSYPIHLKLQSNYYKKNNLVLGEGLHSMHPIAGQGFNLILRDIKKLNEIIKKTLNLGLHLKNSFVLRDFCNLRKPENILFSLGIDFTHSLFKKNKHLEPFKKILIKNIGNYESIKKISKIISDKGIFI